MRRTDVSSVHGQPAVSLPQLSTIRPIDLNLTCGVRDLISIFICNRFSCQKAFRDVLTEVNDQAGQHEVVAENLTSAVTKEIVALVKDLKEERKKVVTVCCP
jgi:hypothetical protein